MPPLATAAAGVTDGPGAMTAIEYQGIAQIPGGNGPGDDSGPVLERRRVIEPYRQAFGTEHTRLYGRPTGWFLATSAFEKVAFPTILLVLLLLRNWYGLALSVLAETTFSLTVLFLPRAAVADLRHGRPGRTRARRDRSRAAAATRQPRLPGGTRAALHVGGRLSRRGKRVSARPRPAS
jgi:hypothetical protein